MPGTRQGHTRKSWDKQGQAGTMQWEAGTRQGQAGPVPVHSCLSLLVPVCPCLSVSVTVCPCLPLSVPVCPRVAKICNHAIAQLRKFWTNKQETGNTRTFFMHLSQFDKVFLVSHVFLIQFLTHISAQNCQSEHFDCAKEFTFRKSALSLAFDISPCLSLSVLVCTCLSMCNHVSIICIYWTPLCMTT